MISCIYSTPVRDQSCFRVEMFNALRRSITTLSDNPGKDETEAHAMLLGAVQRKQMSNKEEKKHHVVEAKMSDKLIITEVTIPKPNLQLNSWNLIL